MIKKNESATHVKNKDDFFLVLVDKEEPDTLLKQDLSTIQQSCQI